MIRTARAGDATAVRDVVLAAYERYIAIIGMQPAPMLDDYALRSSAGQVWVTEDDRGIAGVLVLQDGADYFLLDNIAVRPDRQGFGIGRSLLDFAEAEAQRRGWTCIVLYTNALMAENLAIYKARGYDETERRTETGFDRVYMAKTLPAG